MGLALSTHLNLNKYNNSSECLIGQEPPMAEDSQDTVTSCGEAEVRQELEPGGAEPDDVQQPRGDLLSAQAQDETIKNGNKVSCSSH